MKKVPANAFIGPRVEVKKSVFVGMIIPLTDDKEARALVKEIKKGDRKANHVAFGFRIEGNTVSEGMSDDGEPRGTAGLPILQILRYRDLKDILLTVTRYWGGTKLGPGGLKRAYSAAAKQTLEAYGK